MSIDAKELRIDNEVFYFNTYSTVVQIDGFNNLIGIAGLYEMVTPEFLDPIPLTTEILEKCGFVAEKDFVRKTYSKGKIRIRDYGVWHLQNDVGVEVYNAKVAYLHQLQNLYWCLVGKELEINLTL